MTDGNSGSSAQALLAGRRFRFGTFEVDFRERELRNRGMRVNLQKKPFQILELLLRRQGALVTREELARHLWPDLHVSFSHGLNTAINTLRQALGDSPGACRFIETRSGLGYRFIVRVEEIPEPVPSVAPVMSLTRKRYDPRHAPHQDYLKGKYLQSKLTQAELGKSIAHFEAAIGQDRRYALAYTGLAETYILFARLGLLCGEEARERAAVNISTALEIDSDLAEAHALGGRIRHLFAADSAAAESAYIRALELSPEYVEGYVWYAELLTAAGRHAEAGHKMQRAQELAPLSVAVHADAAWICYMTRKFEDCANQAWQALVLEARFAPAQHALGLAYEQMGEGEEAITELQNAHQCSENNVAVLAGLGHACARHGRPAEAEAISSKLDDLSREQRVSPYWRAVLHTGLGDFGAALSSLEEARQENDPWLTWLGLEPRFDSLRASAAFEQFLGRTGNRGGIALSAPNCAGY